MIVKELKNLNALYGLIAFIDGYLSYLKEKIKLEKKREIVIREFEFLLLFENEFFLRIV